MTVSILISELPLGIIGIPWRKAARAWRCFVDRRSKRNLKRVLSAHHAKAGAGACHQPLATDDATIYEG